MTLQLLERDRVRVHADFVLNNLARPTDKFIEAARQRKHPDRAVFFDADKLVADAKARFKLPKNQRDARSWDAVARDLLERAAAEVTKDDECLFDRRSNGLKMDDLPKYQWILHATAEIVCIDSSSPLVEPAYTARALKTMLITTALISDAWIDYVSARKVGGSVIAAGDAKVHERRLDEIVKAAFARIADGKGRQWFKTFGQTDISAKDTDAPPPAFRSPLFWYGIAALYAGYGYCLSQSTHRIAQALALQQEPPEGVDFVRPRRSVPDFVEVAILETTWAARAPLGSTPNERRLFAKARGTATVYYSEDKFWDLLDNPAPDSPTAVRRDAEANEEEEEEFAAGFAAHRSKRLKDDEYAKLQEDWLDAGGSDGD